MIDLREEEQENASDSMRVNLESASNEIDESESEWQFEKQDEPRI
jgi:hypothetical protein